MTDSPSIPKGEREPPSPSDKGWLPIVLCPTDGVDRALLLPGGREVVGAHHNPGGWRVYGEPIEYEAIKRDWRGPGLLTDKPQPQRELPIIGTEKRMMRVLGPLPEGVYPTHFRPNDTVYGSKA